MAKDPRRWFEGRSASTLRRRSIGMRFSSSGDGGLGEFDFVQPLGSESFRIVRSVWPYCTGSGPVV